MLRGPSQFQVIRKFIFDVHENGISRITDKHPDLKQLCEAIERLFRLGFHKTFKIQDYWQCILDIFHRCKREKLFIHPHFSSSLNQARESSSVTTDQGRGRLLIRILLQRGLLDFTLKFMMDHPGYASNFYDTSYSALGNEIYVQIFYSLISQLCQLTFDLSLENAEFLDETWDLPVFEQHELVPCCKLGVRLDFLDGHAVATSIDADGVAAEDNKIELGDIICSMYGRSLRYGSALIANLRNQNEGKPVPVCIIKNRLPNGLPFPPLESLLKRFGFEHVLSIPSRKDSVSNESSGSSDHDPPRYLSYIGQCSIGPDGGVDVINSAILKVLMNRTSNDEPTPVHIELGELGVTVWKVQPNSGAIDSSAPPLFQHSFPHISSCGRRTDGTNYLAYIAGKEPCSVAKNFQCFVFEATSREEAKFLIQGIAQGFDRTHWTL